MSRSACLTSYDYEATSQDLEKFKQTIEFIQGRLYYKKAENGYLCHCCRCQKDFTLSKEQLQQTKEAGCCFNCALPVKAVQKRSAKETVEHKYLIIMNEKNAENGYDVYYKRQGYNIKVLNADHVLHHGANEATFIKSIVKNMGYSLCRTDKDYWRKERQSYVPYISYFYSVDDAMQWDGTTRKDYYMKLDWDGFKSNQLTFIKNGIYCEDQLAYIKTFDLNYPEELHKYARYISIHKIYEEESPIKFSVNTLDYLDRNNYPLRTYIDYLRACKTANVRIEKYPKDLFKKHDEVMKLIQIQKDKIYDAKVKERHELLRKKEWKKGQLEIHTFEDLSNMQSVAEELKNCIARMYVKPYCEETTDVYYGTIDGKVEFALEVANGKLVQLRGHCNRAVDETIEKFVKQWCTKYTYQY